MKSTKRMLLVVIIVALAMRLVGCFGSKGQDIDGSDSASAISMGGGSIFVAGTSNGRYMISRFNSQGELAPGSGEASWGFGRVNDPSSEPLGWMSFSPPTSGSGHGLTAMARENDILFVTGSAGSFESAAGFATVDVADGSLLLNTLFSISELYSNIGANSGSDIFVRNSRVYVFGRASRGAAGALEDLLWVAERDVDGTNPRQFGDLCGIPVTNCPPPELGTWTGYATLLTGFNTIGYGSTVLVGSIAYSVFSVGGPIDTNPTGTEERILIAKIDLDSSVAQWEPLVLEGDETSSHAPHAIAVQTDGKVLIAGSKVESSESKMFLIRYEEDGSRDSTFGNGGEVTLDVSSGVDNITDIAVRENGKIVAVGSSDNDPFSARFLADGSLDTTYSPTGYQITSVSGYVSGSYGVVSSAQRVRAAGLLKKVGGAQDLLLSDLVNAPS